MFRKEPQWIRVVACMLVATAITVAARLNPSAAAQEKRPVGLADEMLESLGTPKGLCVVLGSQDGKLAIELSRDGQYLVHGLCKNGEAVERARQAIAKAELRGVVSAEEGNLARLPYSDNIVNLVVVDDVEELLKEGLDIEQVIRVLRPGGVAWLGTHSASKTGPNAKTLKRLLAKAGVKDSILVERHGLWARFEKPRPKSMDDWTHSRGDASGNPVSSDTQVGVPTGVRWVAGPNWPTGNRKSSVQTAVASKNHLVYVFEDEVVTKQGIAFENSLIGRDVYNGLRLWRRKAESLDVVSDDTRVYTKVDGKLVALDGETGKIVRTFDVAGPDEFLVSNGLLVVAGSKGIVALDSASGKSRWTAPHPAKAMRVGDGRLFVHVDRSRRGGESQIFCIDLKTGEQQWEASTTSWAKKATLDLILYSDGVLVTASNNGNHVISAKDGSHLWDHTYPKIGHGGSYAKVMASAGLVWVHTRDSLGSGQYAWEGLDPQSGKMKRRLLQPKEYTYKHRCSYDVGTNRVFLCGSMDFAELDTGKYRHFGASRTSCRTAGLIPANGLIYTFPHACGCFAMMRGFIALETKPQTGSIEPAVAEQLEKGPAFSSAVSGLTASADWPTYRHDVTRSGSTSAAGPAELAKLWVHDGVDRISDSVKLEWSQRDGGRLTSPVIAGGLAFVADGDSHRLLAVDAGSGKRHWSFTTGGRIDCPPTIHDGLCLFGSHDGYVYCLTADEGKLVWRYRASSQDRRIVAYGQLESARPVVGGVLVYDGLAYFVAGRHSASDGGILVQAVEPKTGKFVWAARVEGHDGVPDVLTGGKGTVQMASWEADAKTGKRQDAKSGRLRGGRLGLLNDAWYKRPIATRRNLSQWQTSNRPTGQMLAFNKTVTCGYRACEKLNTGNGEMSGNAQLFAKLVSGKEWSVEMPTTARMHGMVVAGDRLYVAGLLYEDKTGNGVASGVRVYNLADGKKMAEHTIKDKLIHDCLAVANGRLYVSTQDGNLICLGTK